MGVFVIRRALLLLIVFGSILTVTANTDDDGGATDKDNNDDIAATILADDDDELTKIVASIELKIPIEQPSNSNKKEEEGEGEEEEKKKDIKILRASARIYDGEDVGVGAFRFAEEYSKYIPEAMMTQKVLDVAHQLQEKLSDEAYTPPRELTHCTSNNKQRVCSAGKLWKRAEEMRKDDMHDVAGADLIRALLKTGIEVDFRTKCERLLSWAFGSIQRQRERERREAIEDAKLQKRLDEERQAAEETLVRKQEYEADWVKFGNRMIEEIIDADDGDITATVDSGGTTEVEDNTVHDITLQIKENFVQLQKGNNNNSDTTTDDIVDDESLLRLIKKIPNFDKSVEVLLIEARCYELRGNYKSALSAAGRLIQKAASYDPWVNDSPRMMAATLGANAGMQLGLSDNAVSFYQTVLKFDPEQERARKQYRGLKKVIKLMNKAEEQIKKGYNKAASVHVDDCLSAMRGLDVDSPLFRSKIQLKQCTILSGMGKYEEALNNCDSAVELRSGNDSVSPTSQKEAHLIRAEALLLDMDYDEAVSDFRVAFDLVPDDDKEQKRELNHKLQSTMRQQEAWNGGKQTHQYNEHTGHPNGMPPQRDHAKILQLPIDLDERSTDIRCAWLRKQFKTLVRKFHPDKYKGTNKKRAARKFNEVKEAKEIIAKQWSC